jgi:hypothetical protein
MEAILTFTVRMTNQIQTTHIQNPSWKLNCSCAICVIRMELS